jgi:KDO2-lipid IV(A) lauroyltransferase
MLVDQYDVRGIDVTFFGRTCKVNPLIGELARRLECPIRGARIVRQPDGHHFWGEVSEPLDLRRDAEGRVDVAATMQAITTMIEGWVREHPEQWLWQHRRWR